MTGLDWTGLDRMLYRTALESGNCDRRIGIGWLLGARTDLLDNGLTESLTHGKKDFLGGLWTGRGWLGEGEVGVVVVVVLMFEARQGQARVWAEAERWRWRW